MASVPIAVVDAFTAQAFAGNPAGVCVLDRPADPGWMQQVAAEMRHAETAFCWPAEADADAGAENVTAAVKNSTDTNPTDAAPHAAARWRLRWFTPTTEVGLCGHATLATAHWLRERGDVDADVPVAFATAGGTLVAERAGGMEWLDFPARPAEAAEPPPELLAALAPAPRLATAGVVAATATVHGRSGEGDWLVELADADAVDALAPDLASLAMLGGRGVIVTARASSDRDVDFVSRFFAPATGVDEDPVTGSAHCTLGPLWAQRLGRDDLVGEQRSPRGGQVHVRSAGDRVHLGGQAVTVLTGSLHATA